MYVNSHDIGLLAAKTTSLPFMAINDKKTGEKEKILNFCKLCLLQIMSLSAQIMSRILPKK